MGRVRMTLATRLVLDALQTSPDQSWYGMQVIAATGLPSGTVYPILARLEREGFITSTWETFNPDAGRPRRRYYRMVNP